MDQQAILTSRYVRLFRQLGELHLLKDYMTLGTKVTYLLERYGTIFLAKDPEDEEVTATVGGGSKDRKTCTRRTLMDALDAIADSEPVKKCLGPCKEAKKLYQFSKCKGKKDGRNSYCMECERQRVRAFMRAKRAKARERREADARGEGGTPAAGGGP